MRTHSQFVHDQFDPQAQAYLTSAVHAAGPDLMAARELVCHAVGAGAQILDVGSGAGHLSFALAPGCQRVVALDPSPGMLATVRQAAHTRALPQIETCEASASALPFADATFDLVCSRYSVHHWLDVPRAMDEMRRVVKPAGFVLIIDVLGEDEPLVDTYLQSIELLRDPSHVRDRTGGEWRTLLRNAGFSAPTEHTWRTRLDFASWIARMRTPASMVTAIQALQATAPREVREALTLEADGTFTARTGLFWARPVTA